MCSPYSSVEEKAYDFSHWPSYLDDHFEHYTTEDTSDENQHTKMLIKLAERIKLYENIFSWTSVCTDFEQYSSFLRLLKEANTFLRLISSSSERLPFGVFLESENKMKFKRLLWSLFTGFEDQRGNLYDPVRMPLTLLGDSLSCQMLKYQQQKVKAVLEYYQLQLNVLENEKYVNGSFLDRFKLLAKITKACPIRLCLLPSLHDSLMSNNRININLKRSKNMEEEQHTVFKKSLSVTIIIDRTGISYCRFRISTVHQDFETCRLTRMYGEEYFIRVSFRHAPLHMDARTRITARENRENFMRSPSTEGPIQNISVLMNIACDLAEIINHKSEKINNLLNEISKIERLNNPDLLYSSRWNATSFDPIHEQYCLCLALQKCYQMIFNDGFEVAGRHFQYLMTTAGGVHKNVHIFHGYNLSAGPALLRLEESKNLMTKMHKDVCKIMFSDADLKELQDQPLKMSLRMGLWFTSSISMELIDVHVKLKKDIGEHTDGCGRIGLDLAKKMTAKWLDGRQYKNIVFNAQNVGPTQWNATTELDGEIEYDYDETLCPECFSAFQIRLDGIKGMLVVDRKIPGNTLIISKSQFKFTPRNKSLHYKSIEIVQCSQPMKPARLNFALISLIVGCAKNPIDMKEYIASVACDPNGEIHELLTCRKYAIKFAIEHNDIKSFNMLGIGCPLKEAFLAGYYQNFARRFKISIKKSRRLYGIADFWNILKVGEVYVSVSNVSEKEILGKVLVTKEPCYYQGDLRKLTAVSHRIFRQNKLKDVIVFSCKGNRPEPNKISGSDLDGDRYFVCWDERIVANTKCYTPGNFNDKSSLQTLSEDDGGESADSDNELKRTVSRPKLSSIARHIDNKLERGKRINHLWRNLSKQDSIDTIQDNELSDNFWGILREGANRAIASYGISMTNISIHELFDMRMRIIDSLGSEWTSWQWRPLMDKFCISMSNAFDFAKTGHSAGSIDWIELWQNQGIPKYPHFYPSKGKYECQRSRSALGYIYDTIIQFIQHTSESEIIDSSEMEMKTISEPINFTGGWSAILKFLRNADLPQTAMVWFEKIENNDYRVQVHATNNQNRIFSARVSVPEYKQILNNTEPCPDTLYDSICQLKFNFLLDYTNLQQRCRSSVFATNDMKSQYMGNDDQSLKSFLPNLKLEDILNWYNRLHPKTFLEEEAKCTMLWKLMILNELKKFSNSEIHVLYLRDGSNLNHISSSTIESILNLCERNSKFICINDNLFDGIVPTNWIDKKCSILSSDDLHMIIEKLGTTIENKFWRDLGLPYPDGILQNLSIIDQPDKSPYQEISHLVNELIDACYDNSYDTSTDRKMKHSYSVVNNTYSKLRDLLGCLICFSAIWDDEEYLMDISEKLAELCTHYIAMYEKTIEFIDKRDKI